jgi:predicted XRE-type DNA-binding protein
MSKAFASIKKGLKEAITHQKGKARDAENPTPSHSKRNIGKELVERFEALKAWRHGKLKLKSHVVERPDSTHAPIIRKRTAQSKRLKIERGSGNVYLDIGFSPEEAQNLHLRSALLMRIKDGHQKSGATTAATAKVLGLTTPRFNALLKGKINLFSLDALVNIAVRAGLRIELRVKKAA